MKQIGEGSGTCLLPGTRSMGSRRTQPERTMFTACFLPLPVETLRRMAAGEQAHCGAERSERHIGLWITIGLGAAIALWAFA